jgi:hypothetical protein
MARAITPMRIDPYRTPPATPRTGSRPSASPTSPRRPQSPTSIAKQQRRIFLEHLAKWSENHDSSAHFNGKISLVPQSANMEQPIGLGQSIQCILENAACKDARKQIVIRLYPPGPQDSKYKLVVRYGAGWISAREYLSKEHFDLQHRPRVGSRVREVWNRLDLGEHQSQLSELTPASEDSVTIRPLFRPFLKLPVELQQMILGTAAGVVKRQLPRHTHRSLISIKTMFSISKALNTHLVPWVYRTTHFCFGTTEFTNFLWQIGPLQRAELKHITFAFSFRTGQNALVHFLRWLAPTPIINLFEPPVPTTPPALALFWRCQIQDLARELRLAVLTLDISDIPAEDLPMIARILKKAFVGVERVRFTKSGKPMDLSDATLNTLREKRTWRQECRGLFERQKNDPGLFSHHRANWLAMSLARYKMTMEGFEREMDSESEFFDQVDCAWA